MFFLWFNFHEPLTIREIIEIKTRAKKKGIGVGFKNNQLINPKRSNCLFIHYLFQIEERLSAGVPDVFI